MCCHGLTCHLGADQMIHGGGLFVLGGIVQYKLMKKIVQ